MDRIFVTGGSGFLGRALMRSLPTVKWTSYSRDEHKHRLVEARYGAATVAGDITDYERLKLAMTGHRYVIHAAASKYVDRGEVFPEEVARANVLGTLNVLQAAQATGVERVVIISTDKAVEPRNAYGLSKALCEYLAVRAAVPTVVARYGNVLGSTGSVVERWLATPESERLTITNPDMTRYWMTVGDAAKLVWLALTTAPAYTILVPKLRSATILDLAHACVGVPRIDIAGERLGEKVHETLLSEVEAEYAYWDRDGVIILRPPHALGYRERSAAASYPPAQHSDTAGRWPTSELAAAIREPLP
jgi:UDP-glucose 4-epimerase